MLKNEQGVQGHKKLVSRLLAKEYLKKIKPDTFDVLEDQGVFRPDFDYELHKDYLTKMLSDATKDNSQLNDMAFGLELLIEDVMRNLVKVHEQAKKDEIARIQKVKDDKVKAHQERLRMKREREEEKKREEERKKMDELKSKIEN
jgi:hypothetical protein